MAANGNAVLDAIVACGVNNAIMFNGDTAAQRIVDEIFDNDFLSCIDKDINEVEEEFQNLLHSHG